MNEISEWIEAQREVLLGQAQAVVDAFWQAHIEHETKGGGPAGYAQYGVRARRRRDGAGGVAIEWFRYRVAKKNSGGWIKLKQSIARHGGYRYTKRELSRMEPWEWAAAIDVEDVAEQIRRQNEALTKISYLAREYQKRQAALDEAIGEEAG